ncbi:MAG TPA: ABC transporter permease [Candidatus Kapabacteria bacterium]|nr:ABC transporter permease [Candidatus Kapabacteria bacterium]
MENATIEITSAAQPALQRKAKALPHAPEESVSKRWIKLAALPLATMVAMAVHFTVGANEPAVKPRTYSIFLCLILGLSLVATAVQPFWSALRRWMLHNFPLIAGGITLLTIWQFITSGVRLLPLPYFPSPASVLQSLIFDWRLLAESTWHSLWLQLTGYALGVIVALVTGVCIGWFPIARYWGMPLLKIIGPIPATAWVPLAMVLSPSGEVSAMGLVALAVWFPVSMLTISGIANTRASYLDVARTLGAKQSFLIFRVAIPAAMPNIFIGLFMGLGTSFITLIVAETVGVKSGLGWYLQWAQGWAEYNKVFAALAIMAVFFSTIMTLLFKLRDRVLVWQKGTIKW